MKIKLSELIGNEIEREFITQFCKEVDKYIEGNCDAYAFCSFVKKAIKEDNSESFYIYFDVDERINCWVTIYEGVFLFDTSINDKEGLIEYIFGSEKNNLASMNWSMRNKYENVIGLRLKTVLKCFLTIFIETSSIIGEEINYLSDLFDYTEEPAQ